MLPALKRFVPNALRPKLHIVALVQRETGGRVRGGPFAGLDLGHDCQWLAALLGIYERELWPIVEEITHAGFDRIVNVGAAEGYYTVGLARLTTAARVIAFEGDALMQARLRRIVALNGVKGRIEIEGFCAPADLARALDGASRPLVICDVEGYEAALLDPQHVPLDRAAMLVELHDHLSAGISALIRDRFARTHIILEIEQIERDVEDFPFTSPLVRLLPRGYLEWAVSEGREAPMRWFWMQPQDHK